MVEIHEYACNMIFTSGDSIRVRVSKLRLQSIVSYFAVRLCVNPLMLAVINTLNSVVLIWVIYLVRIINLSV